jgi:hypothetical protein
MSHTIGWIYPASDLHIIQLCRLSYDIKPFKDVVFCDVSPLEVCDVLLVQPYLCKFHDVYESRPRSVIITLNRKLYRIPEVVPPSVISLIFAKQCRKVISHTGKFVFFMIHFHNKRKITTTSRVYMRISRDPRSMNCPTRGTSAPGAHHLEGAQSCWYRRKMGPGDSVYITRL